MNHAKTIAMARGVLAEGRLDDAAHMIEPLLAELPDGGPVDDGQLTLRCLMARVHLLRRADHRKAFELLKSYVRSDARVNLPAGLRAEVALWLGWASAWQDDELYDEARALNLLDAAEQDFREELNASGRCWSLLGQAQAYFTIDEYRLMLQALGEAGSLLEKLDDVCAETWYHHLRTAGARFEGRYGAAERHVDAIAKRAEATNDDLARGRALAHRAVLALETGRNPSDVVDLARRAARHLTRAAAHPGYSLLSAYHAHASALIRQGSWREAEQMLAEALERLGDLGTASAYLTLHVAHIALLRGDVDEARAILDEIRENVHRHHHLLRSRLERVYSECALMEDLIEEAADRAGRALRHARDGGHHGDQLAALLVQARVAIRAADEELARRLVRDAEAHSEYFSLLPFAAERFLIQGLLFELRGRADEARAAFAQALSAHSLIGDVYATAVTQTHLARLSSAAASTESAPLAKAALDTFEVLGAAPDAQRARVLVRDHEGSAPVAMDGSEADVGSILARSAVSVELVSESWLQAAEELAPDRWLVVYRYDADDEWALVHRHGRVPDNLPFPDPSIERLCADGVDWMRLRGLPAPAFFFGMECGGDDDPACAAIEKKLLPWIPVVGLALEHAMLRASRLGDVADRDTAASRPFDLDGFIYTSPGMRRVAHQIQRVRSGHSPVLITGERGVGKSVVARAIHDASDRWSGPFVPVSCSGISSEAVVSALFGPDDGEGALHAANNGTLYLDEIGQLPPALQPRLLRLLEDGTVESSSGRRAPVDVRIVASSREDLRMLVREGKFMEELYYRLSLVPIRVPPLRERREEIPLLVHHFLKDLTHGRSTSASVTSRALDAFIKYDWPGNVRQLRNEIERLLVFAATEPVTTIDLEDLADPIGGALADRGLSMDQNGALDGVALDGRGLDEILANAERSVIEQILARHDGQVSATADALGLSRQGLYKKMKRLGIDAASAAQR